jgi:transposase
MQNIALDSHKRYSELSAETESGKVIKEGRIQHTRGAIRAALAGFDKGSPVAVETIGNWYWIVDEIEAAGMIPRLTHAGKAKVMMGCVNKTDKLDVRGLNRLQRCGTLPTVWIPPSAIRDERELTRTRMVIAAERTRIKNRIHATLGKYGLIVEEVSDVFGKKGQIILRKYVEQLPTHTRFCTERLLEHLDEIQEQLRMFEQRMKQQIQPTPEATLLRTLPGIGEILSAVVAAEVGDVNRFADQERLASYSGTTPRIHASGGKCRMGGLRSDVNHYLKWAFVEAASVCCLLRKRYPNRHVTQLYERISKKRGHQKAIGAVARHLAEATYWVLKKGESYRGPCEGRVSQRKT